MLACRNRTKAFNSLTFTKPPQPGGSVHPRAEGLTDVQRDLMKLPPGYVPGSGVHKATGFGGFGERLLRQQGWQKGEGLGKDKTGRVEAIEVKKKEDTVGVRSDRIYSISAVQQCAEVLATLQIGGNKVHFSTDKWWEGAFNTALNVVSHEVAINNK